MLRVDLTYVIRHKALVEGKSRREIAAELGISRNTVRKYVEAADPQPRRTEAEPRSAPMRAAAEARIRALLEGWRKDTTKKQRVTGELLYRALHEEGIEVGITVVREVFAEVRRQEKEAFIPLEHRPGEEAQVDFFEVTVDIAGQRRKAWKFVMRSMYSGRDFAWIYDRCDQLSLMDGHVRAFAHFGAVPQRIIYDNMRAAVRRFLRGGRELTVRFLALANHYVFEPCFARPYRGDDKGGVEARGGAIRRQHLTPIPNAASLDALSVALLAKLDTEAESKVRREDHTVLACFEEERPRMLPLPARPFVVERAQPVSIRRNALAQIDGAWYSVPSEWKLLDATAYVSVSTVRIVCRGHEVSAPKQRSGGRHVRQRHYLVEFARKPQALRQNAAELLAELGEPFGALWRLLVDAHGPRDAARLMSGVVRAIVQHGDEPVAQVIRDALAKDRLDLLELANLRPKPQTNPVPDGLADHVVEQACAADFDQLLRDASDE